MNQPIENATRESGPADFYVVGKRPADHYWFRIGWAKTFQGVRNLISENEAARKDTIGGLLGENTDVFNYRIFQATWEEITQDMLDAEQEIR